MEDRFELFTSLIFLISRSILRIKSKEMEALGLKSTHLTCLYYLDKGPSIMTATDIKNLSGEDKAVISRTLDFLKKEGYIFSECKNEKGYKNPLYLTEKGKKISKLISNKIDDMLNKASIGISNEERKVMYDSLRIINKNLDDIVKNNGE